MKLGKFLRKNKIIVSLLIMVAFFNFFTVRTILAQLQTESNEVRTKIGNPPEPPLNCPVDGGYISNGSLFTPNAQGFGHCDAGYIRENTDPVTGLNSCRYPGTKYAVDVAGASFQETHLPKVNGHVVEWTYMSGYDEVTGNETILKFAGKDTETNERYYLQFHHQAPGSGKSGKSGEVGGRICGNGCASGKRDQRHVHVQIGTGDPIPGTTNWIDAGKQIVCR